MDRIPRALQLVIATSRRIQCHDSTEARENSTFPDALLLPALIDLVDDPIRASRMDPPGGPELSYPRVCKFKNGLGKLVRTRNTGFLDFQNMMRLNQVLHFLSFPAFLLKESEA